MERLREQGRDKDPAARAFARAIVASAIFLVMTACESAKDTHLDGDIPNQQWEFNHPATAPLFLDEQDQYYDNVRSVVESADSPTATRNLEYLAKTPITQWVLGDTESARQAVKDNVSQSTREGTIPLFAIYNIPDRDLGGQAAGGMPDAVAYKAWIDAVSDSINDANAVVILEPDALPDMSQMPYGKRTERVMMLRDALAQLRDHNENTAVYLDAGNSNWLDAAATAELIRSIDPEGTLVGGISLNVSYQGSEAASRKYGADVSRQLGRELHILIDNSMNGAPDTDTISDWCNPAAERIGRLEDYTFSADQTVETAYVKAPGESDGACGVSGKKAGEFDAGLLLRQVS